MTTPPDESSQHFEISGDASLEKVQIGGQAGRDLNVIQIQGSHNTVNVHPGQRSGMGKNLSRQEYRNRLAVLTKVRNFWVKGVLERSLHQQVLITLGMEERSQFVSSPWNRELVVANQPPVSLPEGTSVVGIFDHIGVGRALLILGEPGSGKTISLLQLAKDLLDRAEQDADHLIPVVLNLSSWQPTNQKGKPISPAQSIAVWLIEELNSQYQIPRKVGKAWVEEQHLLLLLDGLDEVQSTDRNACITALNAFQQEQHTEMVVCCRIKDYEALNDRLNFDKAIHLNALTLPQVQQYLASLNTNLTTLQTLLTQDPDLQDLARSPLMLHMMVLAYEGVELENLPITNTLLERQKQLFDTYIDRMFERSRLFAYSDKVSEKNTKPLYSRQQATRCLIWLSQRMIEHSQTIFLIEKMQPTWLDNRQKKSYGLTILAIPGLSIGLIAGLGFGLIGGSIVGWFMGLVHGLIAHFLFWIILVEVGPEIKLVEKLGWSWRKARDRFWFFLKFFLNFLFFERRKLVGSILVGGFILGLCIVLFGGTINNPLVGLLIVLVFGLLIPALMLITAFITGLITGLVLAMPAGLITNEVASRIKPNQGIWTSARYGLMSGLVGGLMSGVPIAAFFGLFGADSNGAEARLLSEIFFGIFIGVPIGVMSGLSYGGTPCIKHFALRFTFYHKGQVPWNYAKFLDWASDRLFLQKVGGGYIFIHRTLMEHFAQLKTKE